MWETAARLQRGNPVTSSRLKHWLIQIQPLCFHCLLNVFSLNQVKHNLFFPLFQGSDGLKTHTYNTTLINTCKHKLTHACCEVLFFWQWPWFAWGLVCFWLCGWIGNLGTNCCSLARNLMPWIAAGSSTMLTWTTDWVEPVRWNLFWQKCPYSRYLFLCF